ncbi:amino acid permease [Legionella oakridgensis]|uniref:Amino acid transporter n=2 Tax=Legionella oakridgensis TaxID=29423 RepID=W0BD15_9GAMM|nr:amino acid permease [Legionella oakridgensis]AHE68418.1 amino acid transporter [Legionella oakridgensis ATCC 33761 = DSM 21215]ETO92087.1 amino acid/polyamine/organocation transporter, APC superfamily [Legionella oakridgensis RV-2-2007]KTD38426.1 amino acid transporter PotE [Legionella oakridgensis]STY21357.1 basic amino acid/polyamine antiporter, APA family [Legionella longbeachae]
MDLFRKKEINSLTDCSEHLLKCLSATDLTFLGIGAIIGAGIFVLTGIVAATQTGPAIVFSYIMAGLACAFSALSYAELAAAIGGCGSAYGYAYAGFGEFIAWIVGWDLLLEYSIAVSAVSVGWSSYFNDFLLAMKIHIPVFLLHGPVDGGIINLLAMSIIGVLSILLIWGVKSSSRFNTIMVLVKLVVIFLFIAVAVMEVNPKNWVPFSPFGWSGVMQGASLIFFAYVGFDAVSTAAEEALHPQRDLPIGIIGSLLICTTLYIIVSGLLTGIVHYSTLNVASPISRSLLMLGYKTVAGMVGVGAIAGLTTVMLVLFYGLSRVFFAMARDGLLPQFFSVINIKTRTPVRIIILCGLIMALTSAFVPIGDLAELVNIGTLFAFVIVCSGVIILRYTRPDLPRPFKTPFMPYVPILGIVSCVYLIFNLPWFTMLRFIIWMMIGMLIYFTFSRLNSTLQKSQECPAE